jgi:hypothetical protein
LATKKKRQCKILYTGYFGKEVPKLPYIEVKRKRKRKSYLDNKFQSTLPTYSRIPKLI